MKIEKARKRLKVDIALGEKIEAAACKKYGFPLKLTNLYDSDSQGCYILTWNFMFEGLTFSANSSFNKDKFRMSDALNFYVVSLGTHEMGYDKKQKQIKTLLKLAKEKAVATCTS